MPQPCKLCTYPDQVAVNEALVSGATDRAIGREFGMTHVSVGRHRREHVVKPMQAATAALDKGRAVRERPGATREAAQRDPTGDFYPILRSYGQRIGEHR